MAVRLGIDAGTTNVKVAAVTDDGVVLGSVSRGFPVLQPRQGWHEIDPESWWTAMVDAVHETMARTGLSRGDVGAIGLSGIGCTPCAIDSGGALLANAPTWADSRAEAETAARAAFADEVLANSGSPLGSWSFVPKLWWWQAHQPRMFERIDKVLHPTGYLIYRMTGDIGQDLHTAPLNYAFDVRAETWNLELAERLDVPAHILPPLVPRLQPAGAGLTRAAADRFGLNEGTTVVNCGGDPVPVSLAVGVYRPGQAFLHTGTGSTIGILAEGAPTHPSFLTQLHIQPGVSYLSGLMSATGASMLWARDTMVRETIAAAAELGGELDEFELMSALAAKSRPGANGVTYLPYLFGRQSPTWDAEVRGTLLGLSTSATRGDIVRSVMEGVAHEVASNLPIAAGLGAPVDELRAGGGPTKSDTWNQIYADVCGVPVTTTVTDGDAAIGAAWMSAVAAGAVDLATCADTFAAVKRRYEPRPALHRQYAEIGARLAGLYPALKTYYSGMTTIGHLQ